MLNGEYGEAVRKAMEILVRIGEALGAPRLIPVTSVHVSGISVNNIGVEGVELIEWFARNGARVLVKRATINPMGFDLDGIMPRDSREWALQLRLLNAFRNMGFSTMVTCTPYDAGNRPGRGEHIAWSESSAVLYANSVLGARTNREGGIVALAAGITGRIYLWGMHLDEERMPTHLIRIVVKDDVRNDLYSGVVGAIIGSVVDGIPLIDEGYRVDEAGVRNLLAAAGAWGSLPLIYLPGVTPDYRDARSRCDTCERLEIDDREIKDFIERVGGYADENVDAIFVGCPHVNTSVLDYIMNKLEKCGGTKIPFYVAVGGHVPREYVDKGLRLNIRVVRGTCMVVTELSRLGLESIATNSMKAAFYLPRRHGVQVKLGELDKLVSIACGAHGG